MSELGGRRIARLGSRPRRTCGSKNIHETLASAKAARARSVLTKDLEIEKCALCDGYHLRIKDE